MIQEIFAFLFSAEGGDEVASSLDNVNKKSKEVVTSNKQLSDSFVSLTTSVISITAAWKAWSSAMNITNQNDQLYLMQEMTGIGARTLAELGLASEQFGGNIHTASHALMGLERNIMQLRKTGSGPLMQAGMWYGLNIASDPEKMLRNIARRMESLPRRMKFDLGRMLGLDNATIMLLGKGVANLEKELKRAKEYTFVDEKKVEQSHELKKSMSEMGYIIGGIGIDVMAVISPHVKSITEWLKDGTNFLKEHKDYVTGLAIGVGIIWFCCGGWKTALSAIALIAKGLTFSLIVAAAEDIYKYFTGADSVLGKILEKHPTLKSNIDAMGDAIKTAWEYFSSGQAKKDVENAIDTTSSKWEEFKKWWKNRTPEGKTSDIVQWLGEMWEWLKKTADEGWDGLAKAIIRASVAFEKWRVTVAKPFITGIFQPLWDLMKTVGNLTWDWGKGKADEFVSREDVSTGLWRGYAYAMNDSLPFAEPLAVQQEQQSLREHVTKNEGYMEHLDALPPLTQEIRELTEQMKTNRRLDAQIGTGAVNTKDWSDQFKMALLNKYRNDNPINANITVNINPETMDMNNALAIGQEVGEGTVQFLNSLGTYSSGRR